MPELFPRHDFRDSPRWHSAASNDATSPGPADTTAAPVDSHFEVTEEGLVRVLLIEDDVAHARLVVAMLESVESVRFTYAQATSVKTGLEQLMSNRYDIVLLDLGLPDSQGLESLRSLIAAHPDVPIVVLSGDGDEALALRAVKGGAQDYLIKGQATPDVLGRAIRYAIERKHSELQMKRLAYLDPLTLLPNRRSLLELLEGALRRAHRAGQVVGVLFVDIDQFKDINDTLGHEAGDEVLKQLARRLRQSLRETDTLARLSGDEFVAVVEVKRRHALVTIAESLLHQLKTPIKVATGELFITASVGVSASPADGSDATTLLRNADRAMYGAKAEGRDTHRFYSARLRGTQSAPVLFSSGLRRAVERNELILHFQPLINLRKRAIDGMEALVRWQHPSRGLVPPGEFIPLAEESGLILSIERWVMHSAMIEALRLGSNQVLKLSINLSTRHFDQPTLLAELRNVTKRVGFDPRLLELELSESGIMHHPKRVLRHLKGLRHLGIRVAIDDFGTGYSCLGLMKRLPLNALKIDRSFVSNCETDHTSRTLVAAVIRMGHALGLEVTAEGVETAGQLAYLQEQGCDRAQGSYFSQPISAEDLLSFLKDALSASWARRLESTPGKRTKLH